MAKRTFGIAMVALLALGLVACRPAFPEGSELQVEMSGSVVVLGWDEPTVPDPEKPMREFSVLVDGVEVSLVDGFLQGCRLHGLEDATTYTIGVIARDEGGRGSEPLTAEVTTAFTAPSTEERYCSTAPPEM